MRKIVIVLISSLVLLIALVAVFDNPTPVVEDSSDQTTDTTGIQGIDEAKANLESISKDTDPVATIVLTQNKKDYTFTFELFPDAAPQSVDNFVSLANASFYDGLTMHRLVKDFVMQGGDPSGDGSGGPGYAIKGEFPSNGVETGLTHQVGALAWARSQSPDTAGSQFYIVLNDGNQFLDEDYAVFGYMIDGYENLEYFNNLPTVTGDAPQNPITIKSVSVDTKGVDYPEPDKNEDISTLDDDGHDE